MKSNKLPHNYRLFPEGIFNGVIMLFLLFFTSTLLAINIYNRQSLPSPESLRAILRGVDVKNNHERLARLYWKNGEADLARREMVLSQSDTSSNNLNTYSVLGTTVGGSEIFTQWKEESDYKLASSIYWKSVAADKPDYVSAHIMAAAYALQLGNRVEASLYIAQAKKIDPTNPEVQSLLKKLPTL